MRPFNKSLGLNFGILRLWPVAIAAALLLTACSDSEPVQQPTEPVAAAEPVAATPAPPTPQTPPTLEALDVDAIVAKVLEHVALQPGERVLLVGIPGRWDPFITKLRAGIVAAGAEDLGVASVREDPVPADWITAFTASLAGLDRAALKEPLSSVDLGIMLPGATPYDTVYAALQDVLNTGTGRTVHFHWDGAYYADGSVRTMDAETDAFQQHALLATDYAALAAAQLAFETALRSGPTRITTPAGTDLTFTIGDRPVTQQNGDASAARADRGRNLIDREIELPPGAIRVAPIETTVFGRIAFPPSVWGGIRVEGLTLDIEAGRVVDIQASSGLDAVLAELDAAGPSGRAFREFALGMNPILVTPPGERPWIAQYGYGAGVVRLSLGDNTELGGAVGGGYVRWNFFNDATVIVADEVWVQDGRLIR